MEVDQPNQASAGSSAAEQSNVAANPNPKTNQTNWKLFKQPGPIIEIIEIGEKELGEVPEGLTICLDKPTSEVIEIRDLVPLQVRKDKMRMSLRGVLSTQLVNQYRGTKPTNKNITYTVQDVTLVDVTDPTISIRICLWDGAF